MRSIDWKATARLRKPHVRVYLEERNRPCLLLVDQRLSMFFGSKVKMKSVVAAEVAALGVWGTTTGWPDLIVAAIMAGLFLSSSIQIIRQALHERREEAVHSASAESA